MSYQWLTLWGYVPEFLKAGWLTLQITLLSFVLALALGLIAALAGMSPSAIVRFIARAYVEAIRNTPVLLQIFIVFFGLPSMGIALDAYWAGVIALGVNVGAYLSEVFRAGMQSVPRGQIEAAGILGLERGQIFKEIVLPQAARAVYPAIVNYLIQLLLGTSLLSAIALPELTGTATVINSRNSCMSDLRGRARRVSGAEQCAVVDRQSTRCTHVSSAAHRKAGCASGWDHAASCESCMRD